MTNKEISEQADAWMAVCSTLSEVMPGWANHPGNGIESAVAAIRKLAARDAQWNALIAGQAGHHEEQPDGTVTPVDPTDRGFKAEQAEAHGYIDLFAEASKWSKKTGRKLNADTAELLGWLTGAINAALASNAGERELIAEALKIQADTFGNGTKLHLAMIDWAKKACAALASKPPQGEQNQCDGCAVGAPINEWGNHRYEDGSRIACTKDRYTTPQPEPVAPPAGEALPKIASEMRIMLGSATELSDGIGDIVGYQIKTGALHRILGMLSGAGHPVTIAAKQHATAIEASVRALAAIPEGFALVPQVLPRHARMHLLSGDKSWATLLGLIAAAPSPSAVQPLSEAQHSRIEADEALMRTMREDVIWAFAELNGIDVADDNNCMKATLAALGNIDTALRKRLESSK